MGCCCTFHQVQSHAIPCQLLACWAGASNTPTANQACSLCAPYLRKALPSPTCSPGRGASRPRIGAPASKGTCAAGSGCNRLQSGGGCHSPGAGCVALAPVINWDAARLAKHVVIGAAAAERAIAVPIFGHQHLSRQAAVITGRRCAPPEAGNIDPQLRQHDYQQRSIGLAAARRAEWRRGEGGQQQRAGCPARPLLPHPCLTRCRSIRCTPCDRTVCRAPCQCR